MGDIESLRFLEAIRQFRRESAPRTCSTCTSRSSPSSRPRGEAQGKPTQPGERAAADRHPPRRRRLPLDEPLSDDIRRRSRSSPTSTRTRSSAARTCPTYFVPEVLQAEGLDALVCGKLGLDCRPAELGEWQELHRPQPRYEGEAEIALVGKYVKLHDAYLSVHEALKHAGVHHGSRVRVRWVDAENMSYEEAARARAGRRRSRPRRLRLTRLGGQDPRLPRRPRARDPLPRHLPRDARRRVGVRPPCPGLEGANSTEMDPETPFPVIDLLPEQKEIEDLGGTMRLGAQAVELADGRARVTRTGVRRPRAAPPPLRGEQRAPPAARRRRPRRLGHLPGRAPRRDRQLPDYRGSSRASSIRSSSRGRPGRRHCSGSSSARRSNAHTRGPESARPPASFAELSSRGGGDPARPVAEQWCPARVGRAGSASWRRRSRTRTATACASAS